MKQRRIREVEVASLLRTPADKRTLHFFGQVCDWRVIWALRGSNGWLFVPAGEDQTCMPLWPHEPYAQAYAAGREGLVAIGISLKRWLSEFSDLLGGRLIEIFPTVSDRGELLTARAVRERIRHGLSAYGADESDLE